MSEIRCFKAGGKNVNSFLVLWMENLRELWELGGDIRPDGRARNFFAKLFRFYAKDPAFGVCVIAFDGKSPIGTLIWGVGGPVPYNSRFGKIAFGWGTYVRPEYRRSEVSKKMRKIATEHLREEGYDTLVGGILPDNAPALAAGESEGYRLHQLSMYFSLREDPLCSQ
jgi:GNAT superfamily N-acetyltransferase